ncbi:protein-disulfide reductase DsbD [Thiolinea disciformis]|uniref:protein-disulfide reductase DsbD n=1 Tax=Thiolinea disciformis TaxID=125614 RepID=UPI0003A82E95|nr:protein-disulfide reductase DsbD [Thiolinea disciformis]
MNPVIIRFFFMLWLAFLSLPPSHAANSSPLDNLLNSAKTTNNNNDEPLPTEQAFALVEPLYDGKQVIAGWKIAPHYYLYRNKIKIEVLDNANQHFTVGALQLPAGEQKQDEYFGLVQVLHNQVDAVLPLSAKLEAKQLKLALSWQGCAELLGVCYPPERKVFSAELPSSGNTINVTFKEVKEPETPEGNGLTSTPLTEQDRIANTLSKGNSVVTLLSFFGFGLLLAFTPCMFPMIPILSGIIAGQKDLSSLAAFRLSLVYVLAMASTYTIAGVITGLLGANLQAFFQHPWILISFSLVFVLLALAMFGFYELQMPAAIQNRLSALSNRQSGGSYWGVAIMGVLSALIVGPCVAAPLAGALIYIGQSGDAVLGGAALFALSLGMGTPLLAIGTSAGKIMPRAGAWMEKVRVIFGFLLLAVALVLLERIVPAWVNLLLWAALLISAAIYMGAISSLPVQSSSLQKVFKGLGLAVMIYGVLLILSALQGGKDVFHPIHSLLAKNQSIDDGLHFQAVKANELPQVLSQAQGKPVMLDFYADWCVSCKEMERYTFPDPAVKHALGNFSLLQIDVTANTPEQRALMKQYNVIGPPAMLFFNKQGQELASLRLVGFMKAEPFTAHIQQVTAQP